MIKIYGNTIVSWLLILTILNCFGFKSLLAADGNNVCLLINTEGTDHVDYPNVAWNRLDVSDDFKVYDGEVACFDLSKSYYMSYFLHVEDDSIWYGTKCYYAPSPMDEGLVLHYIGFSGDSICPLTESK